MNDRHSAQKTVRGLILNGIAALSLCWSASVENQANQSQDTHIAQLGAVISNSNQRVRVGDIPPELSGREIMYNRFGSEEFSLGAFRGQVVLIQFDDPWSKRWSINDLNRLHRRYVHQGLQIIGYTNGSRDDVTQMMHGDQGLYTCILGDSMTDIGRMWDFTVVPFVVVIDANGRLAWRGPQREFDERLIPELLVDVTPWPVFDVATQIETPVGDLPPVIPVLDCIKELANRGAVGNALIDMENTLSKVEIERDDARNMIDQLTQWRSTQDKRIEQAIREGDAYHAWLIAKAMADIYQGNIVERQYREMVCAFRNDVRYEMSEAEHDIICNRHTKSIAEVQRQIEAFESKYPGNTSAIQRVTLIKRNLICPNGEVSGN